jgi:rod shape-determining protein MreD
VRIALGFLILVVAGSLQVVGGFYLDRLHLSIDLPLVCVICSALIVGEGATIAIAVCAGLFTDAFSVGPFGHSVAVCVAISLLVHRIRHRLWRGHWTTQASLCFAGTIVAWVLYNAISMFLGQPLDGEVGRLVRAAALNACAAPLLFKVWNAAMK